MHIVKKLLLIAKKAKGKENKERKKREGEMMDEYNHIAIAPCMIVFIGRKTDDAERCRGED